MKSAAPGAEAAGAVEGDLSSLVTSTKVITPPTTTSVAMNTSAPIRIPYHRIFGAGGAGGRCRCGVLKCGGAGGIPYEPGGVCG